MDALLSLPLLSVFLLPTMTSWSTSLNVLFFYLTWSTLLLSHSKLKVEFLGTLFIRGIFYLAPSLLFLLFDAGAPSVAVNTKHHGEVAIATSKAHGGTGRRGKWWRVTLWSIFNIVMSVALQTGIDWLFTRVLRRRSRLRVQSTLPLPWAAVKDVARAFILRELLGYLMHRFVLHSSASPLRSLHLNWYHSLPATYSMAAHYDHPLAYLVRVFIPTYLPCAFFRYHILTFNGFLALVSLEELFVYSGYTYMPLSILLGRIARRQEVHLMNRGRGNFAPNGLADLLAGTSVGGTDIIDDIRDEIEQDDVPDKVRAQAKKTTRQAKSRKEKARRILRGEDLEDDDDE